MVFPPTAAPPGTHRYGNQPNGPIPTNGNPSTGPRAPGATPSYFTDKKKGEVNELKNLLRDVTADRDLKRKREIIKKVIAYMTLGIDVSRLFSEMVLCVDTKDIITKKMVYLYLTSYANKNSELAIMCINTLLNDCRNEDPMVRGLALRSLCSLRLDSILEYIHDPLQQSLTDSSAYVRKTGVIGILKVYSLNAEIIRESDMIDTLYNMIRDRDTQVVSNCLVALNEIMANEGGIAVNQPIIMHLLNRIHEFNEWGQCNILQIVGRYKPANEEEIFGIMNILEQCLRVSNSAVVLGTAKCFLHLTENMDHIQDQVFERMRQPLLTLMAGGSHELNYCVLHHILLMTGRRPDVFSQDYRQFYTRYNEPSHVKYVKIDILSTIADSRNVTDIITELSEYVSDVDQTLARRAIRAIADIGVGGNFGAIDSRESSDVQDQIIDSMVDFLEMNLDYVRDESVIVLKDLIRKFPEKRHDVLPSIPRVIATIEEPNAKSAVIWMIGEYGQDMRRAPYILEKIIDSFSDETAPEVLLELLTASLKLFFKRPPEMQQMLGRLLDSVINESSNQDVRDRALLYYRLLERDPDSAGSIVAQFKTDPVQIFAEMAESDLKEKLFEEFNTLSVVYNKPSETFISSKNLVASVPEHDEEVDDEHDNEEEERSYDGEEEYVPEHEGGHYDHVEHDVRAQAPPASSGSVDLLDMDFGASASVPAPVSATLTLTPNPNMDAPTFQQNWTGLPVIASVHLDLPQLPAQGDIEAAFTTHLIYTMASGDVGPQYKFFFYAQDTDSNLYLVETMVDKANRTLQATVKGSNSSQGESFRETFERVLFG